VLDADHNGVIDQQEIANASAALKQLDKNGDGQLTREELGPPPPPPGMHFPPPPAFHHGPPPAGDAQQPPPNRPAPDQ
jgi:hypothetical protein